MTGYNCYTLCRRDSSLFDGIVVEKVKDLLI